MTQAIDRIRADHRNATRLLQLLEREARHIEAGTFADYPLLSDIMRYIVDYADQYHHPLEDEIFARLKQKKPDTSDAVDECYGEHQRMTRDSQALQDRISQLQGNAVFPREELLKEIRQFVEGYRRHMKLEEDELLPAASAALDHADWRAVTGSVALQDDPIFGKNRREEYKTLYAVILAEAGEET